MIKLENHQADVQEKKQKRCQKVKEKRQKRVYIISSDTLVESPQIAQRITNNLDNIEKAAKIAEAHGNKPANISAEEWAMILSHRKSKGERK